MDCDSKAEQIQSLYSRICSGFSQLNKEPTIVCKNKIRCVGTNMKSFALETLTECIRKNIYQHNSVLIVGEPGRGKTFLATHLMRHLLCKNVQESLGWNCLPIYIDLPTILNKMEASKTTELSIATILSYHLSTININETEVYLHRIVLIIDGFDECNVKIENYSDSAMKEIFKTVCQVITFSRSDVLQKISRHGRFGLDNYVEFELMPFSHLDIRCYIQQFIEIGHSLTPYDIQYPMTESWDIDKYTKILEKFLDLKELCETPLLLSFILPCLPKMVEKYSTGEQNDFNIPSHCSTQTGIFDEFTEQWFEFQSNKFLTLMCHTVELLEFEFQSYCRIYSQNLAVRLIEQEGFLNEGSWTESQTLEVSLLEPVRNSSLMKSWSRTRKIFEENPLFVKCIRDSCLLTFSNEVYRFFHRSLSEYFAAKEIAENLVWVFNAYIRNAQNDAVSNLNIRIYPEIVLRQLGDRVRANKNFMEHLLQIVRMSAEMPGLGSLSSRAMTILNASKYNFSGQDFRNVIIPYADMTHSICAKTDFRGANLEGVNFKDAYLVGARFEGANMSYLNLGEELQVITANTVGELNRLDYFVTPLGSKRLINFYAQMEKYREGRAMNRNDKVWMQEFNFDTGMHVKSYFIGRFLFSNFNYKIIVSKYILLIWEPIQNWDVFYDTYKNFKLRHYDLRTGKSVGNFHFIKWFDCPKNAKCEMRLKFDDRGRWVGMRQNNEIIVTEFSFGDQNTKQLQYPIFEEIKLYDFAFAPNKDWVAILTSQSLIKLTIQLQDSAVCLTEELILNSDGLKGCYSIMKIDQRSKYIVFKSGPKVLKLYNIDTESIIDLSLKTESISFSACDFNHDSSLLATGDSCSNVIIWNAENGLPFQTFSRNDSKSVDICFHPETNMLACSMEKDAVLKFWIIDESLKTNSHFRETDKFSHGNIAHLTMTSDKKYVGSLYFNTIQLHQHFGEPDKRELHLNIWKVEGNEKPVTVYVGKILGRGLAFDSSHSNNSFVVACTLLYQEQDFEAKFNCPRYFDFVADPVALVYDVTGHLIYKQQLRHDTWKEVDGFVYRSALCLSHPCCENNLVTSLWDGSIQLWKFTEHMGFLKTKVLSVPHYSTLENSGYRDPLNTRVRSVPNVYYWLHVHLLYLSKIGDILISLSFDDVIRVWYLMETDADQSLTYQINQQNPSQALPSVVHFDNNLKSLFWLYPGILNVYTVNRSDKNKFRHTARLNDSIAVISGEYYEPFTWLICGDAKGTFFIWLAATNKLILTIPFWFPIYAIVVSRYCENSVIITIGGFYKNLLAIHVNKNLAWEVCHVFYTTKSNLIANSCHISQSLQIREWNRRILFGLGAVGKPAPLRQNYCSFHDLFRELPDTADNSLLPSEIAPELFMDNDTWIVSVVAKQPKNYFEKIMRIFGNQHLFLVLEGTINLRKFAIRTDLTLEPLTGNVVYILKPYESYSDFCREMKNCKGRQWQISPRWGRQLIYNIREGLQEVWQYDFFLHNCIIWCYSHLRRVGVPCTYRQILGENVFLDIVFSKALWIFVGAFSLLLLILIFRTRCLNPILSLYS